MWRRLVIDYTHKNFVSFCHNQALEWLWVNLQIDYVLP